MESDIAMMTTGYLLVRVVILAAFAYLIYRALRLVPRRALARSPNRNAGPMRVNVRR